MSRYIDVEPFENALMAVQKRSDVISIAEVLNTLMKYPAADVAEVRHGRWKGINRNKYNDDEATCSVCGVTFSSGYSDPSWWDYCPNCGAKMDGE